MSSVSLPPVSPDSVLCAKTALDDRLMLVDFAQATPQQLQMHVETALQHAHEYLDQLDKLDLNQDKSPDNPDSPKHIYKHINQHIDVEQALTDIMTFEHIGTAIDRSWGVVSHLNAVMSNDEIRHVHHELLPKLSSYSTKVGQHQGLFHRYQTVYQDKRFLASLDSARQRAIFLALQGFELSGVGLAKDKQLTFADIERQLSSLSAKFADNVLDATQAFKLPLEPEQLSGISETGLAMLAAAGEAYRQQLTEQTKQNQSMQNQSTQQASSLVDLPTPTTPTYVATLDIPVYLAVMTHADDRLLREQLYQAYVTRASELDTHTNNQGEPFNNADIMAQILQLRQQKAQLLGFDDYTQVSLATKMADNADEVNAFLRQLAIHATPTAKQDLQLLTDKGIELGILSAGEMPKPWDLAYLAEKVKQDRFHLSQEDIRPYFPLPAVINGLFAIVKRLYGISAVDHSQEVPLWHSDVRFYQLYDDAKTNGDNLIGGFYFDLYARQGKRSGAWMNGFQARYANPNHPDANQLPVCFMVGNFTPADSKAGTPSLLTHDEVLTLFHEFGHGLHHLLTQVTITDVAGVNGVEWDAVELPSQFMENWAWHRQGIEMISRHVQTGETLPQDKLDALLNAKNFQSGLQTLRQIEFALFDLLIHRQVPALDYAGILQTLDSVRDDIALLPTPKYNRFANGFSHIFAGGYASGYYSYKWAELLSADAFSKFEAEGIFNQDTGQAFRQHILSVGGSDTAKDNFKKFRGRDATIDALLRHSGFIHNAS